MSNPADFILSVCTVTYNHENYIEKAIESVLSQKANFKIEIVIGEDCSTDNTREIVARYAHQYPEIIKPIFHSVNLGIQKNFIACLQNCKGKYIAVLDGDDYFTDPLKLQNQVDFLEKNPEFSMCFTDVDVLDDYGKPQPHFFPEYNKDVYTIDDIINVHTIPTVSLVCRNCLSHPLPLYIQKAITGDIALELYMANVGKAKYINEKTAVYRQHANGISKDDKFNINLNRSLFDLLDEFNIETKAKYNKQIKKKLFPLSKLLLMYGSSHLKGTERKKHIARMFRGYFKYGDGFNVKEVGYYFLVLYLPFIIKFLTKDKRQQIFGPIQKNSADNK